MPARDRSVKTRCEPCAVPRLEETALRNRKPRCCIPLSSLQLLCAPLNWPASALRCLLGDKSSPAFSVGSSEQGLPHGSDPVPQVAEEGAGHRALRRPRANMAGARQEHAFGAGR